MAGIYQGYGAGAFGGIGGSIHFEWVPKPYVIEEEVMHIAGALENTAGPIALSREEVRADIRERFVTKTAPDGSSWAPWAESYVGGGTLLVDTGELSSAATGDAIGMDAHDVWFDWSALPEYGIWHQLGAERGVSEVSTLSREEKLHQLRTHGIERGKEIIKAMQAPVGGNNLPARPFAGLSLDAELRIVEIFDQWFQGAIGIGGYRDPASGRFTSAESGRPFARLR